MMLANYVVGGWGGEQVPKSGKEIWGYGVALVSREDKESLQAGRSPEPPLPPDRRHHGGVVAGADNCLSVAPIAIGSQMLASDPELMFSTKAWHQGIGKELVGVRGNPGKQ